jgi:hypothetical protein
LQPGAVKRILENMILEAVMAVAKRSIIFWDVVNFYQTTQCPIPKDSTLQIQIPSNTCISGWIQPISHTYINNT